MTGTVEGLKTALRRTLTPLALPVLVLALSACGRAGDTVPVASAAAATALATAASASFYATPFEKAASPAALTEMGRALFFDASLSASGKQSCASCHDPAHAYGPPNDLSVQLGGPDMKRPGVRAVPSLTYQQSVPVFNEHFAETDGNDSIDQGPAGGRSWDGRASSAHEQASAPLLSPFEMGNADAAAVVARMRLSPNAARFRETFGAHVLDNATLAWNGVRLALEVFQQSPADFYPYSSKYDAVLRKKAAFTDSEQRGLALFNNANGANCAQCHPSAVKSGAFPQFTDYGFIGLGVPRNPKIPANKDPAYFDLGLCGPLRTDLKDHADYCGLFKTPSLRNVAVRHTYFHNGVFHSLEEVLRFYVQRDLHAAKFYPSGKNGKVQAFNDVPEAYRANVNHDAPFDRKPGDKPALTEAEIKDVVAFLKTLTDGYVPAKP